MKEKVKYYKCPVCGNVIEVINGDKINNVGAGFHTRPLKI